MEHPSSQTIFGEDTYIRLCWFPFLFVPLSSSPSSSSSSSAGGRQRTESLWISACYSTELRPYLSTVYLPSSSDGFCFLENKAGEVLTAEMMAENGRNSQSRKLTLKQPSRFLPKCQRVGVFFSVIKQKYVKELKLRNGQHHPSFTRCVTQVTVHPVHYSRVTVHQRFKLKQDVCETDLLLLE